MPCQERLRKVKDLLEFMRMQQVSKQRQERVPQASHEKIVSDLKLWFDALSLQMKMLQIGKNKLEAINSLPPDVRRNIGNLD